MFSGSQIPTRSWTRIERTDEQTTSFPVELRPDTVSLMIGIFRVSEKLESLSELAKIISDKPSLATTLAVDAAGQPINDVQALRWWILNFLAVPFVVNYLSEKHEIIFDQELFDDTFDKFIAKLEVTGRKIIWLSPLLNVRLSLDSIEISPGLRLRRLTTDELEGWLNSTSPILATQWPFPGLIDLQCAVEVSREIPPDAPLELLQSADIIGRLIDVLRLFTGRNVYILFTQLQSLGGGHLPFQQTSQSWVPSLRLPSETAIIDDDSSQKMINLWNHLQVSQNAKHIKLALTRWSATAERLTDEDKLVDYWIALESLFTSDSSQEVTFRASLRIAAFLGQTADERESIYSDIRHSYNWRSAIVHGDTINPGKIKELNKKGTLPEVTKRTRSYLQTALLKLIEMDESFDPRRIEQQLLRR
jgi:hypothetical protein